MINDTIAAVSTPFGRGGISVIRVSGSDAVKICEKVFRPKNGSLTLSGCQPNRAVYGGIYKDGRKIDSGIATCFFSPNSYTGENTVEISCHGGILITSKVLEAVISAGARPAEAGEFTKRAFLNGKLSLSEAEAVVGIIDSENDAQLELYTSQAEGALKKETDAIRKDLVRLLSSIYAYIDFPDEDMTDVSVPEMLEKLGNIRARLSELKDSYRTGQAVTEGIVTAIVGKPNVGKSSLLNLLLEKNRAIVTDEAGTTRDAIEESVCFGGVTLRLCDTAGIRYTDNKVEKIGVEISREKIKEAGLILAVFDGTGPLTGEDRELIDLVGKRTCEKIALINKSDLEGDASFSLPENIFDNCIRISCATGEGKEKLAETIGTLYRSDRIREYPAVLSNVRQFGAAESALKHIDDAIEALNGSFSQDIAGMDLENAVSALGFIDGKKVSEDIVSDIFSTFCVGK